jgi:hypothetical protein
MVPTGAEYFFSLASWQKPDVYGPIVGTMLAAPVAVVDQQYEPVSKLTGDADDEHDEDDEFSE